LFRFSCLHQLYMKKFLIYNLIFISHCTVFAQGAAGAARDAMTAKRFNYSSNLTEVFNLRYDGIKGSPYFYPEFTEGEVFLTKNRHMSKEYLYKFDEAQNTVEIKGKDNKEKSVIAYEIEAVKLFIEGKTVMYIRMDVPNDKKLSRLFQVLHFGKHYSLVKLPIKKVKRVSNTGPYRTGEVYDQFADKSEYFLKTQFSEFQEITLTKRQLMKALPEKGKQIEAFFEKHSGDIKDYDIAALMSELDK
jgi:hypothetical protein